MDNFRRVAAAFRRGALSEVGTADLARLSVAAIYPCLIFTVIVDSFSLHELVHSWPLPLAVFALMAGVLAVVVRDTGALGVIPGYYGALQTPKGILLHALQMVAAATIPLAMIVAGSSIAMLPFIELRSSRVWLVSALRLLAIPALALALLWCLPFPREQREVLAVVAVMPTSLASITLTRVYGGDEHFTAGTVLLTHLLALATVPLLLGFFLARYC